MSATTQVSLALLLLGCAFIYAECLRTGAPTLACFNLRPIHGLHRAKPASASQFFVTQSSFSYQPGQNITVDVMTHSNERYFRGFIIQAYNPITGGQIGHFIPSTESRPLDSCSAATHKDNLNKKHVTLTWIPPYSTDLPSTDSVANQWLGIRTPHIPQPGITWNVVNRDKRQTPVDAPTTTNVGPNQASEAVVTNAPVTQGTPAGVSPIINQDPHQVRFKASIVVTYDEFYTGFESSDQRYDKWDFAPKPY